jgi:hypothetical protein
MEFKRTIGYLILVLFGVTMLASCVTEENKPTNNQANQLPEATQTQMETPQQGTETAATTPTVPPTKTQALGQSTNGEALADVLAVSVNGESGAYNFSVQIASPDMGCQQYADWWEVIDENGDLIYRRILLHSHVNEQPFTRSGGPVAVSADAVVLVRAHMNPDGYGGEVLKGTAADGFIPFELDPDFAADLEETAPLPDDCAF